MVNRSPCIDFIIMLLTPCYPSLLAPKCSFFFHLCCHRPQHYAIWHEKGLLHMRNITNTNHHKSIAAVHEILCRILYFQRCSNRVLAEPPLQVATHLVLSMFPANAAVKAKQELDQPAKTMKFVIHSTRHRFWKSILSVWYAKEETS